MKKSLVAGPGPTTIIPTESGLIRLTQTVQDPERDLGRELGCGVHIYSLTVSEPGIPSEPFNLTSLSFLILKLEVESWMDANL